MRRGGFQALLLAAQAFGGNARRVKRLALLLHRQAQAVGFRLKLRRRLPRLFQCTGLLRGRALGIFKLHGQRCRLCFGVFQLLLRDGQLPADLAKAVNFRRLRVQLFDAVLRFADIA